MSKITPVQKAALDLILDDVQFFYTYVDLCQNAKNIKINHVCMMNPYLGLFVDGAAQWCSKIGIATSKYNDEEKEYYTAVRGTHKLFSTSYTEYKNTMKQLFQKSDHYFRKAANRKGYPFYTNVGIDIYHGHFCGNTILCSYNMPVIQFYGSDLGDYLKRVNEFGGKILAELSGKRVPILHYDKQERIVPKDYHFFEHCPLKTNSFDDFCFFSILCNINFIIEFLDHFIDEETVSTFKFAYLQYYYLCNLLRDIECETGILFELDNRYHDRKFRNCLAHYGLGQYLTADEIIDDDPLKGLTHKAFGKTYEDTKVGVFEALRHLSQQIGNRVLWV